MPNNGAEPMPRLSERWNDERISSLRSSAADIRERAAALGQWRAAFECAYFNWAASRPV